MVAKGDICTWEWIKWRARGFAVYRGWRILIVFYLFVILNFYCKFVRTVALNFLAAVIRHSILNPFQSFDRKCNQTSANERCIIFNVLRWKPPSFLKWQAPHYGCWRACPLPFKAVGWLGRLYANQNGRRFSLSKAGGAWSSLRRESRRRKHMALTRGGTLRYAPQGKRRLLRIKKRISGQNFMRGSGGTRGRGERLTQREAQKAVARSEKNLMR